jgi:hypothetical protein
MATFSVRVDASRQEQQLISFCEGMRQESRLAKELTDLKDAETNLGFVRGQQLGQVPRGFPPFILNLLNDHVQRKTGLLTDARPMLEVVSGNDTMKDRTELLTKCLQALWDETTWQETLAKGIAFALQVGCNVGMIGWDPLADMGRGDIRARFFDPRAVFIDPAITAGTDLPNAEFVITEEVRSIAALIEQFGARAEAVRPDGDLSSYPDRGPAERGLLSPAAQWNFRQRRRGQRSVSGQVPRAYCRHYRFKDWDRDERGQPRRYETVGYRNGTPVVKTRRRILRHVVVAGGTVLVDEPSPEWHGGYNIEVLDWGMESEHLYGQSEIRQLRSSQEALNKLIGQILRNTNLLNNFMVVGDTTAMDPDAWDSLSNRPAVILRKRPNSQLEFRAPPSLPPYLFTVVEFLVKAIDLISGMGEAAKGSGSPSQSGIAVEALQIAAQTTIRLQARRIEAFLARLFQKAIALIFQHYNGNRVLRLYGPGEQVTTFKFDRAVLTFGLDGSTLADAFRDFTMHIQPGSSLNATKIQRAVLAGNLHQVGVLPDIDLLKASEWPNAEATLQEARHDQLEKMQLSLAAAAMGGGGGAGGAPSGGGMNRIARGGSAQRQPASFPANAV